MDEKQRVFAFFDGSNFYHNSKNNYGITNINFLDLTNNMLDLKKEKLNRIKYFNSPVNQQENPEGYISQQKFLGKVKATPLTTVYLGNLVPRPLNKIHINCITCGHQIADTIKCPKCNRDIKNYQCRKISEKGVDVNIAVQMLLDAIDDKYDVALLFSADADFAPAIEYIVKKLKKEVVYCRFPSPKTYKLLQTCSDNRIITKNIISNSECN